MKVTVPPTGDIDPNEPEVCFFFRKSSNLITSPASSSFEMGREALLIILQKKVEKSSKLTPRNGKKKPPEPFEWTAPSSDLDGTNKSQQQEQKSSNPSGS